MSIRLDIKIAISFILMFAASLVTAQANLAPQYIQGATTIRAPQLKQLLSEFKDVVIIDVRDEFAKRSGNIPGAVSLPLAEFTWQKLSQMIKTKKTQVVFYSQGARSEDSSEAVRFAVKEGYQNVYWFNGGLDEWKQFGYSVVEK